MAVLGSAADGVVVCRLYLLERLRALLRAAVRDARCRASVSAANGRWDRCWCRKWSTRFRGRAAGLVQSSWSSDGVSRRCLLGGQPCCRRIWRGAWFSGWACCRAAFVVYIRRNVPEPPISRRRAHGAPAAGAQTGINPCGAYSVRNCGPPPCWPRSCRQACWPRTIR